MDEINSIEALDKTNLTDQKKFRLSEIIGIENYFYQETNQRKSYCKKINKYVIIFMYYLYYLYMLISFDYIDNILIVLSATNGGVLIISFTSIFGAPVGVVSATFTLIFSITTGIIKKLLSMTRNKMKKHDKILMLAKSKLNSIETLISKALNDMNISHEEFITILKEKDKYERMKDVLKSEK